MDWIKDYIGEVLLNYYDEKLNLIWTAIKVSAIDLSTLAYILFIILTGYKTFFKKDEDNYQDIYIYTMAYVVLRLFWKVKFGISR